MRIISSLLLLLVLMGVAVSAMAQASDGPRSSGRHTNGTNGRVTPQFVPSVPEPSTLSLLGMGVAGTAIVLLRRRSSK